MFWISGAISRKIGVNGVLTWSFTSYVLRFMIYASIKNPWQVGVTTLELSPVMFCSALSCADVMSYLVKYFHLMRCDVMSCGIINHIF